MSDVDPDADRVQSFANRFLTAASMVLAIAGGLLMLALAFFISASVLMRWQFGEGINGDFDLVQIATALAAFAFLPFCQTRRGNVAVDTFTNWLPPWGRAALDALWDLVWAGFAAIIAWRLAVGALDAVASETTSMVMGIPLVYPVAACAVMAAFLVLVAGDTALRLRKQPV